MFKELQSALTARSNEVNSVAFNIQMFISERAQDLAPEQSRHLLRRLQQLQRTFHGTSGQAQAWADALSAQKERETEWQRREIKNKEDREKHAAGEREVWNQKTGSIISQSFIYQTSAVLSLSWKLANSFCMSLFFTDLKLISIKLTVTTIDNSIIIKI